MLARLPNIFLLERYQKSRAAEHIMKCIVRQHFSEKITYCSTEPDPFALFPQIGCCPNLKFKEKKMEQNDLVEMATEVLSFVGQKVDDNKDIIDMVLHEAMSQNQIGKRLISLQQQYEPR